MVSVDPQGRPVREVSYHEQDGRKHVAAIVGDGERRDLADGRGRDAEDRRRCVLRRAST